MVFGNTILIMTPVKCLLRDRYDLRCRSRELELLLFWIVYENKKFRKCYFTSVEFKDQILETVSFFWLSFKSKLILFF